MFSAIPHQVMLFTKFSRSSLILRLLLGGCFAFLCPCHQAQAQLNISEVFVAQRLPSVYPGMPPAPPINEPLPSLPSNPQGYRVPEVNAPVQRSIEFGPVQERYISGYAPYKVYVYDNYNDYGLLQRVRRFSPKAFRRQIRGRSVIQVGAFTTENRARNLARELEFEGIRSAQIVNDNRVIYNGQENSYYSDRGNSSTDRSKYYYVVIPGRTEDLRRYLSDIRRYVGVNAADIRNEPRGTHIAVGPFAQRSDAEEWNRYLRRDLGYGNARVYYGR